jgi:1,4-alpha-glucan branching enzyme
MPLLFNSSCNHYLQSTIGYIRLANLLEEEQLVMSISKKYLKSKPICKVTFTVPKLEAETAQVVYLVGEFNDWQTTNLPMKKQKSGDFKITLDLSTEREYQFRYLLDADHWKNDSAADKYVASPYGEENSVIVL